MKDIKDLKLGGEAFCLWGEKRSCMKGQSLIEVLIALALAAVVVSAVTVVSITALSNAQYIKNQDGAVKYAQEGIEIIRGVRNSDYAGFRAYSGIYCLDAGETTLASAVGECTVKNLDDTYIRSVEIVQDGCSLDVSRVTVVVAYASGKCRPGVSCHKSELASCFSTVNPIAGP